jgi:nitrogen fixation protein NifQ
MHQHIMPAACLRLNVPPHAYDLYSELMARTTGLPNDEFFAQMLSSQARDVGGLPPGLGLGKAGFPALLARHFPGVALFTRIEETSSDPREFERDDVLNLLLEHRAGKDISEQWMAQILTAGCMASDHLWQDLGLLSRDYLSSLMTQNFPALAGKNIHDMKWKKFLYKQLCEKEGINACRAPSCEYCVDYLKCFGPEE